MSDSTYPQDYRTVTPYLVVPNVARLLEFLATAFGAIERVRVPRGGGSIMHAEVVIGDSIVMMGEPTKGMEPIPGAIFLRVSDADASYQRAIDAGAISVMKPADQPHAKERYGGIKDPCGNVWWPASPLQS